MILLAEKTKVWAHPLTREDNSLGTSSDNFTHKDIEKSDKQDEIKYNISFYKLFAFVDSTDLFLMAIGW